MIRYLLQHGANPQNAYSYHRKALGNVFSKDPLSNPVKILVIGNSGEGKSTLIEAMEIEPTALTSFKSIFVRPKEVDGVNQKTAGIIPRVYNSGIYGEVQTYDFAGQEAYYSSHAAVIKTAVDTCPPILMLVIDLNKNDEAGIASSVSYWLGIIANQCTNLEGKAPLIVIGSHADLVTDKQSISRKEEIVMQAVARYPSVVLERLIPMDNRYSNSIGMKILRSTIGPICTHLRSNLAVSLNAHMFLVHLIDKDKIALSLKQVQQELQEEASQPLSKKQKEVLSFIPTSLQHLVEICVQLNDKGHILFLHNTSSPTKSFIVAQKEKLLGRVNGSIFAPKDFDEHCQVSTSTGVVPRSKLVAHFPDMDPNMIIGLLTHYEFIVPIDDPEVLRLINQHRSDAGESVPDNEEYHFCPGLITLEILENIFQHLDCHAVHFGWVLFCSQKDHFLDARFLHVLLLRISLSLQLAPVVDQDVPSLQHQCFVWKTGVCWSTADGIKILLEVVDKKKVIVLMQAHQSSPEMLELRSTVMKKVVETCSELCSTVVTEEALLPQDSVTHPVTDTTIFSVKSLAESVVGQKVFVVSTNGILKRKVIDFIPTEVYTDLGVNILAAFFNENDPTHDKKLSDRFILALSNSWNKNCELADIVCLAVTKNCKSVPGVERGVEHVLNKWRDCGAGTCRALRVVLDPLSVFTGKNLLVSSLIHTHLLSHAQS